MRAAGTLTPANFQTFEAIAALVVVLTVDGQILYWNRACSDLTGYSLEEVRGRHVWDFLLVPEEVESGRAVFANLRAAEHQSRFAFYWVTKTGERRWLAWSNTSTMGPEGQVQYIVATGIDQTNNKRTEEVLRASESKLSGLISIATDAIISVDEDHRIVIYNEGAEKTFGWKREEILGQPLEVLLPNRLREVHRQHVRNFEAVPEKARKMGELRAISGLRKDGVEFSAEAAISKLEVDGVRLFTVVLRDISERKRAENEQQFLLKVGAVLASTLEYEQMLDSVGGLLVGEFADCCILDLVLENGQVARVKVLHRDPTKAPVADALLKIQVDRQRPYLASQVFETGQPMLIREVTPKYLESIAQSDEHLRVLRECDAKSVMALPLTAHGRLIGAVVLVRSSASHRYETRDLRLGQDLAYRVALAVENARLFADAQRAIRARDDVLGIVAHDLRNPLNSILLQAQLLERRGPESTHNSQKQSQMIVRSARQMNRLIEDLLDVTRLDAGGLSIECQRAAASQLVDDVLEAEKAVVSSASLELQLDVTREAPDVWADRTRLLRVFENLIGNAVKFTEPGGRITLGAEPRAHEVLFWVSDTGAGIPAENIPYLFDRFWQARPADRRGAGLGLAIVKGIIEAHGGRIWVESTPGCGSTFFFTIPTASKRQGSGAQIVTTRPLTVAER